MYRINLIRFHFVFKVKSRQILQNVLIMVLQPLKARQTFRSDNGQQKHLKQWFICLRKIDAKTTTLAFEGYFYKEEPSLLTGLPKLHVVYGKNGCKLQSTAALAFEAYNYRRIFSECANFSLDLFWPYFELSNVKISDTQYKLPMFEGYWSSLPV